MDFTGSPSRNTMKVGIESTLYAFVVAGLVSTSSWTTLSRSPSSAASALSTGPICRHGGHQSAVNSTSTGSPEPITSVTTTDSREPVPEFTRYQDQANELDAIATRISRLIEQMRWRGVYDATVDQDGSTLKALENAEDGTLLPHDNFQMLREKGGIEGALGFVPIERIYPIVAQLNGHVVVLHQGQLLREGTLDAIRANEEVAAIYLGRAK